MAARKKPPGPDAAPAHLGPAGAELWRRLIHDFSLRDSAARALLQTACECTDRLAQIRAAIDADGASVTDRFGQRKPHGLLAAERDARSGFLQAMKGLGLTGAPEGDHA
jgi:phage terminase small subunit